MEGLRTDQEKAGDDKEKEVKEQEGSEETEVGEHSGVITLAQPFQGRLPQLEGEAAARTLTPRLKKTSTTLSANTVIKK